MRAGAATDAGTATPAALGATFPMTSDNHKHAARLLAAERHIGYAHALRLVRDQHVYPRAWTYTYRYTRPDSRPVTGPAGSAGRAADRPGATAVPPARNDGLFLAPAARSGARSGARSADGLVPVHFFNTTSEVLTLIASEPPYLPYLGPDPHTLIATRFTERVWSAEHLARYPALAGLDDSLLRPRWVFHEPYAMLRWTAARAEYGSRNPEDDAFDFPDRDALFDELLHPPYLSPGLSGLMDPPDVPAILERALFEENLLSLEETVAGLCEFLLDWPTSVAGWVLLGEIQWSVSTGIGWQDPFPAATRRVAHKAARMAWQTAAAIIEGAIARSTPPPGFALPYGYRGNRPVLHALTALIHLEWADGHLDAARALAGNLLVLDARDPMQVRKMRGLYAGEPYPPTGPESPWPTSVWGPQFDDFEIEQFRTRHHPTP